MNQEAGLRRVMRFPTTTKAAVMTLTTLADMRELLERHLPTECRERETRRITANIAKLPDLVRKSKITWRHVADRMNQAARGGDIDEAVTLGGSFILPEGV
jgi:hypothetical protein